MVDRWCLWAIMWPRYVQQNMHARNGYLYLPCPLLLLLQ